MARPYPFAKANPARPYRRPSAPQRERSAPDIAFRKTGISLLGDVPWGTHVCMCYETKQDLIDANIAWFKEGLAAHESCLWAVCEPVTVTEAKAALRSAIPGFNRHLANRDIEIIPGKDWYLPGGASELGALIKDWHGKNSRALASGRPGLRLSGNALWEHSKLWKNFIDHERMVDAALAGHQILLLCTYSLGVSRARDILDMARFHQCAIARREGTWEFLQVPRLARTLGEIRLDDDVHALRAFRSREHLTPRETIVLAQIMRGASNKEIARALKISPRTVEFHRANIMQKLGAKNAVELVRLVTANR